MDDFSFDAPVSKTTDFGSDDPTADFLAREQAILGGDADFLAGLSGSAPTSANANANTISSDFESSFPSFEDHDAGLTSTGSTPAVPSVTVENDEFGAFHSDFPEIETESAPVSQVRKRGKGQQTWKKEEGRRKCLLFDDLVEGRQRRKGGRALFWALWKEFRQKRGSVIIHAFFRYLLDYIIFLFIDLCRKHPHPSNRSQQRIQQPQP